MNNQENLLNNNLQALVEELHPSTEHATTGRQVTEMIYSALREDGTYSIDRLITAGSVGKGTAISDEADFDIVVFVNKEGPPFDEDLLQSFEQAIRVRFQKKHFEWRYEHVRNTDFLIQFNLTHTGKTYEFDLLPASNLVSGRQLHQLTLPGKGGHVTLQAKEIRKQLQSNKDKFDKVAYLYGSSLSEEVVLFLKKKPIDVVKVVKLAKYWNSKLPTPKNSVNEKKVRGRSYLIELIAVKSQQRLKGSTLLKRFIRFLHEMTKLSTLKITFGYHYDISAIPPEVLAERPLVMNPCNPFGNVAHDIMQRSPKAVEIFEKCAQLTLERIGSGFVKKEELFNFDNVHY